MTRRLLSTIGVAVACTLLTAPAGWAASVETGWTVTSFATDLGVQPDGSLAVAEVIAVDFGAQNKHGIFRDIPVRYTYNDKYDRVIELSDLSVKDGGGNDVPYSTSMNGADQELKIGDASRTVTGTQTYVIHYTARGAYNAFSDHDELYWNATGNAWAVPVAHATATLRAPPGAVQRVLCFEGAQGATTPCVSNLRPAAGQATFATGAPLSPGEGLTVVAALATGTIPRPEPILARKPRSAAEMFEPSVPAVAISAFVLVAGLGGLGWLYWRAGRDRSYRSAYYLNHDPSTPDEVLPLGSHQPLVVEFGPPNNLRPAQLGLILDESADTKDMTATIVDLAARGFLTITEVSGKGLLGKPDYELARAASPPDVSGLEPYERSIYAGLFDDHAGKVALSDLKGTFKQTLDDAERLLMGDAMKRRWFTHRPDWVRLFWRVLGVVVMAAGAGLAILLGQLTGAGLVGVALVVVGGAATLVAGSMPARTAVGHDVLYRTLGFRLYMTTAERYRQQFAEREKIFTALLPYAIVFGCVDRWAHAFQDIDVQAAVAGWYIGTLPFNALLFSSSLQGFASSVNTSIASVPAASGASGFSGGGFAGGGFGGGGGGSW